MLFSTKRQWTLAAAVVFLFTTTSSGQNAADKDVLPPRLPQEQRENLQRFLKDHEKPDRFVPTDAKVVDTQPPGIDPTIKGTPEKPIKQYLVQITSHRSVPDQEEVKRVDVYYYRPNPEKGKQGVTVKHTVDLTTGKQVGTTEVLFNRHTPLSREELAEALALAREKTAAVSEFYKERAENMVRWEYLQLMIGRQHDPHEPGDRVVRFVFTAAAIKNQAPPAPVAVVVNLTKGVVVKGDR